jgi:SAM-dependent methyltransferase
MVWTMNPVSVELAASEATSRATDGDAPNASIYATPRLVTSLRECSFFHTMDVPGYGTVQGQWDLREAVPEYVGNVDFRGKRVLDIGAASGFLTFYAERQGADVVAFDLSEHQTWDMVPFPGEHDANAQSLKSAIKRVNNSFWFCHRAYGSNAQVVYGTVYDIPNNLGVVDISIFGCVLLHLRDPFLALQKALRLTGEKVVITESMGTQVQKQKWVPKYLEKVPEKPSVLKEFLPESEIVRADWPVMQFSPDFSKRRPDDAFTWWLLTPEIVKQFIGVLGFEKSETIYHSKALAYGRRRLLYTVVGYRTKPIEPGH